MAWKDSGDAVMYPDGSLVKGPKALCELQGYVYNAWVRMAEVFEALGKPDRAKELRAKAAALFERFNAHRLVVSGQPLLAHDSPHPAH
jgi:glycogen debranching enzyme